MAFRVKIRTALHTDVFRALGDLSGAEHALAVRLEEYATPMAPRHSGALAASARVEENVLSYNTRQAHMVYVAERGGEKLHISQRINPHAQPFWVYGAKKDHAEELRELAVREIKKALEDGA